MSFPRLKYLKTAFILTFFLYCWSLINSKVVLAISNNVVTEQQTANADKATFREVIDRMINAYAEEDYQTVLGFQSQEINQKFISGIVLLAYLRAPDKDYEEETAALEAEIERIEQNTEVPLDKIIEASKEVQGLYVKAGIDSLKPIFPQLDLAKKYREVKNIEYELKILSQTDSTAVIFLNGFNFQDNKKTGINTFVKQNGRWVIATDKEVELARATKDSLHYVSPGLLPLPETIAYLTIKDIKEPVKSEAYWYQSLPPTTAQEQKIEVGNIVFGYVEAIEEVHYSPTNSKKKNIRKLRNLRVIAIEKGENGDLATAIDSDGKVLRNIPVAILQPIKKYIDFNNPLQIGDLVLWNTAGNYRYGKISRIKNSQLYAKYVRGDNKLQEEIVEGSVIPLPREGYLWRKVIYCKIIFCHGDLLEAGFVIAETDSHVWLESFAIVPEIIKLAKKDVELIWQADTDLRYQMIWRILPYEGKIEAVKIIGIIEPGLLYEIDKKSPFKDEYIQLSIGDILLSKPSLE